MAQTGTLPKPKLRGLLSSRLKINAAVAFTFCISMAAGWKFLVAEKRKQTYLDFYKSYDAKADFERMKKAGVFQSVRPDGEIVHEFVGILNTQIYGVLELSRLRHNDATLTSYHGLRIRVKMNGIQDVYTRLKKLLQGGVVTSEYPKHENPGSPILGPRHGQLARMLGISAGSQKREKAKRVQLRGFCAQRLRKNVIVCGALLVCVVSSRLAYNTCRKRKYLRFYETYDADADFERMVKAGVFESVKPS